MMNQIIGLMGVGGVHWPELKQTHSCLEALSSRSYVSSVLTLWGLFPIKAQNKYRGKLKFFQVTDFC